MQQLPIFLNLAGQPVLLIGQGPAADAKARLILAAGGRIVSHDDSNHGARLAFIAEEDPDAAARLASALKSRGLLVNVVDQPALCDFTTPAIIDRAPVTVAIGSGGASASLVKVLRERLEALLPASLGPLARAIADARAAVSQRHKTPAARRHFWDALLASGAPLDPLLAPEAPEAAIESALDTPPAGARRIDHLSLTSGDPDDLTLRQLRLLSQADALVIGPGVPPAILDRARRDAVRIAQNDADDVRESGRIVVLELTDGRVAS